MNHLDMNRRASRGTTHSYDGCLVVQVESPLLSCERLILNHVATTFVDYL